MAALATVNIEGECKKMLYIKNCVQTASPEREAV